MFEGVVGVLLGALLLLLDVVVALLGCAVLSARRPGNRRVLGWLNLGGACLAFAISLVALPGELNEPAILTGRALGAQAVIVALILLPVGQVVLGRALVASRRVRAATHGGFAVMGVAWLASGLHAVWHYPHRTVLGVSLPDLRALGPVSVRTLLEIDAELKRGSYERCFDLFSVTRDEVRPLPEFRSVQAACVGHLVARLHANHPLPDDGPFVTADNFVEKAMSDRSSMLKAPLDYDIVQQLLAAPKRPPDPGWARVLDGQLALVEVERAIYVRGTGAYVQLRVSSMCDARISIDASYLTLHAEVRPVGVGQPPPGAVEASAPREDAVHKILYPWTTSTIRWYRGLSVPPDLDPRTLASAYRLVLRGRLDVSAGSRMETLEPPGDGAPAFGGPDPAGWRPLPSTGDAVLPAGEPLAR